MSTMISRKAISWDREDKESIGTAVGIVTGCDNESDHQLRAFTESRIQKENKIKACPGVQIEDLGHM